MNMSELFGRVIKCNLANRKGTSASNQKALWSDDQYVKEHILSLVDPSSQGKNPEEQGLEELEMAQSSVPNGSHSPPPKKMKSTSPSSSLLPPTSSTSDSSANPVVFFDITISGKPVGRIEIMLRRDVVPSKFANIYGLLNWAINLFLLLLEVEVDSRE